VQQLGPHFARNSHSALGIQCASAFSEQGLNMKDYDAIEETVFHYFEGYKTKNRELLERAFVVEIANMMGYWRNSEGELELFTIPYKELIESWVDPEYTPQEFGDVKVLSINIFSDVGATVVFDCGGKYLDTFQMVKLDGGWRIVNKLFVDQ
jgi:hypothetical protein